MRHIIKPPFDNDGLTSEILNRFATHDSRAENPFVLCESLSIGCWLLRWPKRQRITFGEIRPKRPY
jgi:hypothetical protein